MQGGKKWRGLLLFQEWRCGHFCIKGLEYDGETQTVSRTGTTAANTTFGLGKHLHRQHVNTKLAKHPEWCKSWVYGNPSPAAGPLTYKGNKGSDKQSGFQRRSVASISTCGCFYSRISATMSLFLIWGLFSVLLCAHTYKSKKDCMCVLNGMGICVGLGDYLVYVTDNYITLCAFQVHLQTNNVTSSVTIYFLQWATE